MLSHEEFRLVSGLVRTPVSLEEDMKAQWLTAEPSVS